MLSKLSRYAVPNVNQSYAHVLKDRKLRHIYILYPEVVFLTVVLLQYYFKTLLFLKFVMPYFQVFLLKYRSNNTFSLK